MVKETKWKKVETYSDSKWAKYSPKLLRGEMYVEVDKNPSGLWKVESNVPSYAFIFKHPFQMFPHEIFNTRQEAIKYAKSIMKKY